MSLVSVVIAVVLAYVQLSYVERDFPLQTQHSGTIMFTESGLEKQEILDGLRAISQAHDLEIYLGTPGSEDPFHGLDLYALGAHQPDQPQDIAWLSFTRHGKLYPASELGDTNLSAVYAVKGDPAGVAALEQWANQIGASTIGWGDGSPLSLFAAGLIYGGAGIPLVALAVLWVTAVLAWYAARAESRAVRLLAGTPRWRIQAQDMFGWLRVLVPVAALGVGVVGVGMAILRGLENGLALAVVVAGYLAVLVIIAVIFGLVASAITAPSVASLALRKPPEARFEFPSQLLKAVALALGLAALPAMLWQAASSLEQADIQGRVVPLTGYVTQAVGGVSNTEFESSIADLDRFVAAVDDTDTLAYAWIVNREDPGPIFAAEGFDGIAVINAHYAKLFGLSVADGSLEPVPGSEVERLLADFEESAQYGGIRGSLRQAEATAEDNGLSGYRVTTGAGIVAPTGSGLGFRHAKQPLVLISDRISASLKGDTLAGAGLTSGHVMFSDPSQIEAAAREVGVSHLLTTRSRITDSALLAAQFANQVVFTVGASIVILLAAIAVSGWLSAKVYAANNARFIYPMLTYGRSWWAVLRKRVIGESIIITVTFALVSGVYLAFGLAWSPVLMAGVALYLGYSVLCHQQAGVALVHRVTQRSH